MALSFPPLPPRDELRFEDGDLVGRLPEIDDAQALFDLLTDPRLPYMLDVDRPQSVEQYREGLSRMLASEKAGKPAKTVSWVAELQGTIVGLVWENLDFLDKNGGREGPLLRTAVGAGAYFKPEVASHGVATRFWTLMDESIDGLLVRHFGIEQLIGWMPDDNELGRAWIAAAGGVGPINHNHPQGLGLYRRPARR